MMGSWQFIYNLESSHAGSLTSTCRFQKLRQEHPLPVGRWHLSQRATSKARHLAMAQKCLTFGYQGVRSCLDCLAIIGNDEWKIIVMKYHIISYYIMIITHFEVAISPILWVSRCAGPLAATGAKWQIRHGHHKHQWKPEVLGETWGSPVGEPSWRPDQMAKFGSWYHRIIVVRSRITVNLPCYPCFIMLSWYFLLNITDACFRGHTCYWSCYVNNVLVTLTRVIADSWFNWEFLVDIDWLHKICVIHFQYCNTLNAPNETLA